MSSDAATAVLRVFPDEPSSKADTLPFAVLKCLENSGTDNGGPVVDDVLQQVEDIFGGDSRITDLMYSALMPYRERLRNQSV